MNELRQWMDSKDAVFFIGFVLGALSLALLTALFRALKQDGVRAMRQEDDPTDVEYVKSLQPVHRIEKAGDYFKVIEANGEWVVNVFADSINLEGDGGPYHFVKDGVVVAGASSFCLVSIQGKRQSRYFTVNDLLQSANAEKSQPAVDSSEERQTQTKEGIHP